MVLGIEKSRFDQICVWGYNVHLPYIPQLVHMDVSENRGTPKSSILIGISIINHPFWGTTIFGNTHIPVTLPKFIFHGPWNVTGPHQGKVFCLHTVHFQGFQLAVKLRRKVRPPLPLTDWQSIIDRIVKKKSLNLRIWWSDVITKNDMSHEKNPLTFHYTGCLMGLLIVAYYNPHIMG